MNSSKQCKRNYRKLNEGFPTRMETAKNAERERTRVKSLREGFQKLQTSLPTVPRDTKLSKLDVLILAMNHINHLTKILEQSENAEAEGTPLTKKLFHPVKKWPMRSRLYAGQEGIPVQSKDSNHNTVDKAINGEVVKSTNVPSDVMVIQETSGDFTVSDFNNDWESLFDVTIDHQSFVSETTSFNFYDFIN